MRISLTGTTDISMTNILMDIQLIRKFNGPDLLDAVTYLTGGWAKLVPEIVPYKRTAKPDYILQHERAADDSRVYYDTFEVVFPELTPKRHLS